MKECIYYFKVGAWFPTEEINLTTFMHRLISLNLTCSCDPYELLLLIMSVWKCLLNDRDSGIIVFWAPWSIISIFTNFICWKHLRLLQQKSLFSSVLNIKLNSDISYLDSSFHFPDNHWNSCRHMNLVCWCSWRWRDTGWIYCIRCYLKS